MKRTNINRLQTEAIEVTPKDPIGVFEQDFTDVHDATPVPREDKAFLAATAYCKKLPNGHYKIPMPCNESVLKLESNLSMAVQLLGYLKRKMVRDDDYKREFVTFMNDMIKKDFCKRVPLVGINKLSSYIPIHGVYHRIETKAVLCCSYMLSTCKAQ